MPEEIRADLLLGRDSLTPGLLAAGKAAGSAGDRIKALTRDIYEVSKARATPVIDVQDASAQRKLGDVAQRLRDLGSKVATARADITDKDGLAKIAAMQVRLDALGKKVASPRITLEGVTKAEAEILALDASADHLTHKLSGPGGVGSGINSVVSSLGGLAGAGPALFNPITIAAGGLAAIMAGPLIAAMLPITAGFTGLAAVAVPEMEKVSKAVSKGGKALKDLSPEERSLVGPMRGLKSEWQDLTKAVQPQILKLFGAGLRVVKDLMPALKPLIEAAAKAARGFLNNLDSWLHSPSGRKFLTWIETEGPHDLKVFGRVAWDMAQVVGRTFSFLRNAGNTWWRNVSRVVGDVKALFTRVIPAAFAVFRDSAKLRFLQTEAAVLSFVSRVTGIMGKLPGPLGAPFRAAHKDIAGQLAKIQGDVARTARQIQGDFNRLHGKTVTMTFRLNAPAFPGVQGGGARSTRGLRAAAKGSQGTPAGTFLVGEEGPELIKLPAGTKIATAAQTRRLVTGYAGGTGWNLQDAFRPSAAALGERLAAGFKATENAIIRYMRAHRPSIATSGALGGDARANEALARRIFPWSAAQWPPFVALTMAESGFNRFARNPSSGAYGIAQALPPTKYPFAGQAAGGSHAGAQLGWMFGYIRGRYGTPAGAWAHERALHWYGNGLDATFTRPTLIGVGEKGAERVKVTPVRAASQQRQQVEWVVRTGHGATAIDRALVEIIKKYVSINGGNVQVAFGESH